LIGREFSQMAKKSAVEKNTRRSKLAKRIAGKRTRLKVIAIDRDAPPEERFAAQLKLAKLPRNGSETRIRNRCAMTGRPRGYYRKFGLSRIALRELASSGQIPGMVKSSW
jgi:small subunit ribosomal protein S14